MEKTKNLVSNTSIADNLEDTKETNKYRLLFFLLLLIGVLLMGFLAYRANKADQYFSQFPEEVSSKE